MTRARDVADTQENLGGGVPPFVAGKNKIINGDFRVWQRGTSFTTTTGTYTADRWTVDAANLVVRDTGVDQFTYSLKIGNTTGTSNPAIRQRIELPATGNAGVFQIGTTWTLSFWAKSGSTANLTLYTAFADAGGDGNAIGNSNIVVGAATSGWVKYSTTFTITVAPNGTNAHFVMVPYLNSGATAQSTWFTGFQLEAGSVATPFTTATGTIQGELAACQRYYQIITAGVVTATNSTTRVAFSAVFPPMRTTTPTFSLTSNLVITDLFTANFTQSTPEITININNGNNGATLSFNNFSGLTAYRAYQLQGSQQILASAEL